MLLTPRRFGLFLLYYIVEESIEIKTHKINYFTNISNWLDLVVIGVSKKLLFYIVRQTKTIVHFQFSDIGRTNLLHRIPADANPYNPKRFAEAAIPAR